MKNVKSRIKSLLTRKLGIVILVSVSAVCAFATLGDGNKRTTHSPKNNFLSSHSTQNYGRFSLKSGYSFRSSQILNSSIDKKFIDLNTVITLQRGHNIYTIPLKKKVIIDQVKIEIGNRYLKRN